MPYVLIGYLTFFNIVGFVICVSDKRAAIRRKRRVRERTLFLLALLGGALGVWLAMIIFHHKTRKLGFMVSMPLIAFAYVALAYLLLRQ